MDQIGKYKIDGEIGKGGMGQVYLAYDSVLERKVAIKVFLEEIINDEEMKKRFYQEARTAGQLSHPNITVVHDIGEVEGKPYIVMEYLDGTDLKTLIEQKAPLDLEQKVDMLLGLAKGLHHAHNHHLVHRDIKPENVRVLDDGRVKIMDFGIAKPVSSDLTQTGTMIGTPAYMSPEQIRGQKVDLRSDIFSFGVLLQELLSGKRPFSGKSTTALIYNITSTDGEILQLDEDPEFRDDFQKIINRCLQKEAIDRYRDMAQLTEAIEELKKSIIKSRQKEGDILADMEHQDLDSLIANGQKLFSRKKYQMAEKVFNHVLSRDPNNELSRTMMSKVTQRLNVKDEVNRLIERADHFLEENRFEQAIESLKQALSLQPDNENAKTKMKGLELRLASLATMATHRKSKKWQAPTVMVMVLVVGVLGFLVFQKNKATQVENEPQEVAENHQTPSDPIPTSTETSEPEPADGALPQGSEESTIEDASTQMEGGTNLEPPEVAKTKPAEEKMSSPEPKVVTKNVVKPKEPEIDRGQVADAKKRADQARASIHREALELTKPRAFPRAEQALRAANRAYEGNRFAEALGQYEQAHEDFNLAKNEMVTKLNGLVEQEQDKFNRQMLKRERNDSKEWKDMQSLSKQAKALFEKGDLFGAFQQYQEANQALAAIPEKSSQPEPVQSGPNYMALMDQFVLKYQKNFEAGDIDQLQSQVGLSKDEANGWKEFFKNASQVQIVLEDRKTNETEGQITATLQFKLSFKIQGQSQEQNLPVKWLFDKRDQDLVFVRAD